jgi:two-component system chemotaxis sensor kinase CheA
MNEHKQNFIDETGELMNEAEANLLLLEENPENSAIIDSIYRTVHSLKGIAGMFEFESVAKMSHLLENVLSEIKAGTYAVDSGIIALCFQYIDFVKASMQDSDNNGAADNMRQQFEEKTEEFFSEHKDNEDSEDNDKLKSFYVLLQPNADFETRGIKLEAVFSILEDNEIYKKFEKNTAAEDIQNKFYMFWEYLIISKNNAESLIEDLLLESDEIYAEKIADENVLESKHADTVLKAFSDTQAKTDIATIKDKVKSQKSTQQKKQKQTATAPTSKEDLVRTLTEYEISGINVSSGKLDNLMNFVSELISTKEAISIYAQQNNDPFFTELAESLDKTTNEIKDTALSMRLIPLESIMLKLKRLVRDLSKKQNKSIVFETDGTNTELDKTVINMLAEPLMHIIRNSIDHGIENPKERQEAGKTETGRIKLFASHEGSEVVIQIHDDGKGIDPIAVKNKAIEKGLMEPDKQLSKRELLNILFMPGFSTAHKVSDISGRGIGMDVVKQKITDIRGDIDIDSEPGLGTYVTLKLPMTLSILETLQVDINGQNYLIPQNVITNVDSISQEELDTNKKNLLELHGEAVPIVDLTKKFNNSKQSAVTSSKKIVSVRYKDRNVGLITNRIIGEHQAILKPLGELFRKKEAFSGAGILGDGSPALIIDTNKLLKEIKLQYK